MKEFDRLVQIMSTLRSEKGCPWDREQDHRSLAPYLIEETYEIIDTIQADDRAHLCEELGDLLLQIVFHAQVAQESGDFDMARVIEGINSKLIRRHPHVFSDAVAETAGDVLKQWNAIKQKEKGGAHPDEGRAPRSLPSLQMAQKLCDHAGKKGIEGFRIEESLEHAGRALKKIGDNPATAIQQQIGTLLFHTVNIARCLGIDPELALRRTIKEAEMQIKES
jgi:tetrapyrrole methylase family protein / MazG family protein